MCTAHQPVFFGDMYLVTHVCLSRVSDREVALEAALKLLQQFYLDLEKFLNWLTEAETTCNVLIDATNKERLQEQPAARNLLAQWKVGPSHTVICSCFPDFPLRDVTGRDEAG